MRGSFDMWMRALAIATVTAVLLALLGGRASAALATAAQMQLTQNEMRYAAGAPTVPATAALVAAAQSHAAYGAINGTSGHYETAGLPGYTGYGPRDRALAAGFSAAFLSEVAIGVRFDVTVAGRWLTEEWSFTTAGAAAVAPAAPSFHSRWVTQSPWPTIAVGQTTTMSVTFRNAGATTWTKGTAYEARLGVNGDDRTFARLGMSVGWPIPDRPAVQDLVSVPPGASTTFTFSVRGVATGTYSLHLRPVVDGITWMEDEGVYMVVAVR